MTETKPCVECGSDKVEKYRKKCRSCLNCWQVHEMSLADWRAQQEAKEKERVGLRRGMCGLCKKDNRHPRYVGGMLMCEKCNVAFGKYCNSEWREAANTALSYEEANAPKTSHALLGKKT